MRVVGIVAAMLLLATPRNAGAVEAIATAQVIASPERVFALLTDFGSWERVFPGLRVLRAEEIDARHARIRQLTRVLGQPVACTMAVTLRSAELRIDLVLDEGEPHDLLDLASYWRVEAAPDGGAHIELRVVTRSGLPLPASVEQRIVERSTRRTLDDLVRAISDELHAAN